MITSHLVQIVELLDREGGLRSNGSEDRPVSRLGRLLSVLGSRLRQHSPPVELSNHMRRTSASSRCPSATTGTGNRLTVALPASPRDAASSVRGVSTASFVVMPAKRASRTAAQSLALAPACAG